MSVAALPPPSLQPRMSNIQQRPAGRPLMQPRPTSTPTIASRPPSTPAQPQGLKAKSAAAAAAVAPPPPPPPVARRPSASTPRASTSALPTPTVAPASGSKDTSSSSGKVFAKPSKEWVLPERAKPGRKVSVDEPDNKRQSQNRLSQRAHRARRTDYIQTLEERLRQYEADEIHSNVRLQEVARALKADNERLKKEVVTLRMDINDMATQRDAWEAERSSYEQLIGRLSSELNASRGGEDVQTHFVSHTSSSATTTSRTSPHMPALVPNDQRRPTTDCPICPDPDPDCPCQQTDNDHPQPPPITRRPTAPLAALHLAVKAMAEQDPAPAPTPAGDSCGLCQSNDECLCRVVDDDEEEDIKPTIFPTPSPDFDIGGPVSDGCGLCTSATFCACKANAGSSSSESPGPSMGIASFSATTTSMKTSTEYPTPPSTSAVPLRLRRAKPASTDRKPIWSLDPDSSASASAPTKKKDNASCSGDPNNCEACRDDKFGKEFCENLFEKTETPEVKAGFKPCTDCPGNCMSIKNLLSPTSPEVSTHDHGHGHAHAHENGHAHADDIEDIPPNSSRAPHSYAQSQSHADTMTCDQAWKALKAHPNSRFASLSLLADVVAGRTVCTGPQDVGSASGSAPPSGHASPAVRAASSPAPAPAPAHASPAPSPSATTSSAPASTAAKKRNLAVETSAVRDALRLLDKATASPSPALKPARPADGVKSGVEVRDVKRRKIEPPSLA